MFILYTVFLRAHTSVKYFVCTRSPMPACVRALMPPLQRDWCHKIAGVKFVHSDAHKRTFPQGRLQWDFKKGTMYEGVVFQLTLLAAGRHGAPTELCLLTLEWCRGQTAGLESWPWELREISTASLFRCWIGTINNKGIQFIDVQMWRHTVPTCTHVHTQRRSLASSNPTVRNKRFVFLPSLRLLPHSPQPPLLRPDRASVLLSSTPSSFLLPPKHFRFRPPGLKEAHYLTVLSQCEQCTHTQPCQPGLTGVVLCRNTRPTLYQWHQAVL